MNQMIQTTSRTIMRDRLQSYINSRLLPSHIKTVDQAEVIVGIGREIGLPPIASLRTIHLINGNPTVSPAMMLALANKAGIIEDIQIEKADTYARVTILRRGRKTPHVETFTKKDADALGLSSKDNYKKQAKVMYAWRAVSAAMRLVAPEIIFGLYTPEEMGVIIQIDPENELEGQIIDPPKRLEMPSVPPSEVLKQIVEEISDRLSRANSGDSIGMNNELSHLTNGMLADVGGLMGWIESHPAWIVPLKVKMDMQRIGLLTEEEKAEQKLEAMKQEAEIEYEKEDKHEFQDTENN